MCLQTSSDKRLTILNLENLPESAVYSNPDSVDADDRQEVITGRGDVGRKRLSYSSKHRSSIKRFIHQIVPDVVIGTMTSLTALLYPTLRDHCLFFLFNPEKFL